MCKAIRRMIDSYVHVVMERAFGAAYPVITREDATLYREHATRRAAAMEQRRAAWAQRRADRHTPPRAMMPTPITITIDPNRNIYHQVRAWRVRSNGGRYTKQEWELLLDWCDHCCLRCGATKDLTADHVVPIALGGHSNIENIQVLCRSCNSWKGTKIIEFRPGRS